MAGTKAKRRRTANTRTAAGRAPTRRGRRGQKPPELNHKRLQKILAEEGFARTHEIVTDDDGNPVIREKTRDGRKPVGGGGGHLLTGQTLPLWAMAGMWITGSGLHAWQYGQWAALIAVPLVCAIIGRMSWRAFRRWGRVYLVCGLAVAWGTMAGITAAGPASTAAGLSFAAWCLAALPWWWTHRRRDTEPDVPVNPDLTPEQEWAEYVACEGGPLPGSKLTRRQDTPNGWTAIAELRRGKQTATTAISKTEELASALAVSAENLAVERVPGAEAHLVRVTFLRSNPLHDVHYWTRQTLDETGAFDLGPYATEGTARFRLWAPAGGGHAGGAVHSLISGTTGSGKSQFILQLVVEAMLSGLVVTWYADPQFGQSGPELIPYADWAALGPEAAMTMLKSAEAVMYARNRYLGQVRRQRHFTPAPEFPMLRVIVDEAQVLLKSPEYKQEAVLLLEHLTQMGRKVGIGVDLITQVPILDQIGNSEVIRSNLQSGNIIVFRTSGTMSGQLAFQGVLPVRPDLIPKVFPNGTGSGGLCYVMSATARTAAARTLYVQHGEEAIAWASHYQPPLDRLSAAAAGAAYADRPRGGDGVTADDLIAGLHAQPAQPDRPDRPAPTGQPALLTLVNGDEDAGQPEAWRARKMSAADVIMHALREAGRPLTPGELITAADKTAVSLGRSEPYKMTSITHALTGLKRAGRIRQDTDKGPYYLPPDEPAPAEPAAGGGSAGGGPDPQLLAEAVDLVITMQFASARMLARKLRCTPETATALLDAMADRGWVGKDKGPEKPREVLRGAGELDAVRAELQAAAGVPS